MKNYGDITKINGAEVPPVDVIIGGSPCQGLSNAGLQKGLDDDRSCLFLDQVRVTKEMRAKDERTGRTGIDVRPRYLVWENVPGAFTTNERKDFQSVLTEIIRVVEPKAPLCLSLKTDGLTQGFSWEDDGALLGEFSMHSFGESPREGVESHLSQILEDNPPRKYCLSAKACQGILHRAVRRGKELPPMLEKALRNQCRQAASTGNEAKEIGRHTEIEYYYTENGKRKKCSDSARYKALGNSIALPPWKWVLKRISACYERDATMASLFDGIGGFPLIWEQINGKGSCLWISEIEEFPLAVTKRRFGGDEDG